VPTDHAERFAGAPGAALAGGLTVIEAKTRKTRRRGLARLDGFPRDHALLIPQCPAVHTFGMRFALDLIWLRRDQTVARVDRGVPPNRMRGCARARSVIETVAGQADAFLAAGIGAPDDTVTAQTTQPSDEVVRDRSA
jgi:uncharacterized protein